MGGEIVINGEVVIFGEIVIMSNSPIQRLERWNSYGKLLYNGLSNPFKKERQMKMKTCVVFRCRGKVLQVWKSKHQILCGAASISWSCSMSSCNQKGIPAKKTLKIVFHKTEIQISIWNIADRARGRSVLELRLSTRLNAVARVVSQPAARQDLNIFQRRRI